MMAIHPICAWINYYNLNSLYYFYDNKILCIYQAYYYYYRIQQVSTYYLIPIDYRVNVQNCVIYKAYRYFTVTANENFIQNAVRKTQ